MGTIHTLIGANGKQGTLDLGEFCRPEIEAASAYMADEDNAIGYLYSGWCQLLCRIDACRMIRGGWSRAGLFPWSCNLECAKVSPGSLRQ
jgi:hypothetical protein